MAEIAEAFTRLQDAIAKAARRRRAPGQPVSSRYRGKRDGDLNNDGVPDGQGGTPKKKTTRKKPAAKKTPSDLDPSSPNYRFRDTGYVGGSRKELAADMIRSAGRTGRRLRATDIDWSEIEQNPREAKQLITKSNLFGKVDWPTLRAGGMTPGAGFLVDRVYAAIAKTPAQDTPEGRKDYALGLESLRDRLEKCKTADDVTNTIDEIRDEFNGRVYTAEETDRLAVIRDRSAKLYAERRVLAASNDLGYRVVVSAESAHSKIKYEISKRTNRGWKVPQEMLDELKTTGEAADRARTEWRAVIDRDKPRITEIETQMRSYSAENRAIEAGAVLRNKTENPLHRAWIGMGARFTGVLNYRSSRGSQAFGGHVARAKGGRIADWSWAESDAPITAPRISKESIQFQLKVADNYQRIGGRDVTVDSTAALKDKFHLREVQSGNWVLRDVQAAKFHTERAAEAFSDLADIIGAGDENVSFNGRLALAFGARGQGNKGGSAARAHYEPVHRIINLTKMGGGGTLGHEWFHGLDNMIGEMEAGAASGVDVYLSEKPDLVGAGEIRDAVIGLRRAMLEGSERSLEAIKYTDRDVAKARFNVDRTYLGEVAKRIKSAGNAGDAVVAVRDYFAQQPKPYSEAAAKKRARNESGWIKLAAAYHDANPAGGKVWAKSGPPRSSFVAGAVQLDNGASGKYWSSTRELAARAFQSYTEDKLASLGRRNDYLSAMADNKFYNDPIFGQLKPFPEGDERTRINAAFDDFFAVLRRHDTLKKALDALDQRQAVAA